MRQFTRILFTFALLALGKLSFSSHVPGGNITYECVGPNQFAITLTLFEDCGTAFTGNTPQSISINNDCGYPTQTLQLTNTIFQQEVSQLCPAQLGQSECSGGNLPGVWMHQWTSIVTLPGQCDSWTFSYTSCCRNTAVNSTTQDSYYWETILNSQTAPCNNSAQITSQPIPYVCANQPVNFNMAALDPDGNTLVYSLIPAYSSSNALNISYAAGYSGAAPIPGISINPATGQITFTPTTLGNFIVVVLIEEYDANGNLVGSVIQDFQFEVITCTNQVPSPPAGGITNFTGDGVQTGMNSIQACEGDSFCFDLIFTDSDATNILTVTSNVQQSFPNAVVSLTGTNPVTANVCMTIDAGSPASSILSFDVEDNACPIPGINSFPVSLNVITSTYAGPDEIICENQGVQLNAGGGSNFNWTVLTGDPIVVGGNFSCNPCQDPIANPAVTTTYVVTSNLTGGCENIDTITVNVVPDFTFNLVQSSPNSCLLDPIDVTITPVPGGAYTYSWSPSTYLSNTTSNNIQITPTAPGNYTYFVDITSPDGCIKQDSVSVSVAASYAPNVTATADQDSVACGDLVQLDVDLGGGIPATCGPSTSGGCVGPITNIVSGTQSGTNTSTGWPAIYGNWYANSRHQFLFTAAELNAMGFIGGKITEIIWQTTAQNNAQSTFVNFRISMGCTSASALTTTWLTGLTQVYGPQNYTVTLGNNSHVLSTPYEWDGVSNLVVEVCYEWTAQYTYTYNWTTPYSTTPFVSSSYFYSDGTAACPNPTASLTSSNRPITTFVTCPAEPDPANYSFAWTPTNSVSNATIQDPTSSPVVTTTYQVVVTDIQGGCSDTSQVTVFSECAICFPPDPSGTDVSCNGGNDGSITATMVGSTGPWTVNFYDNSGNLLQTNTGITVSDQLNNLAAGSYTIEIIDTAGCVADTVFTINEPTPLAVVAGQDSIICIGGTAAINALASGGTAPYAYAWDNGQTSATFTENPTANTCYQVTVTDANGCVAGPDDICIFLNPPLLGSTSGDETICPGESIPISATGQGGNGGPYNYVWELNGQQVGTGSQISVTPPADGSQYCVTITDNCGTPASTECLTVFFHPVPSPDFVADDLDGCYPVNVNFTNNTDPTLVQSVVWNFGDGNTSTSNGVVSNSYTTPGCYDVSLTVTSPNGCVGDTTFPQYICVYDYPVANFAFGPQPTNLFNTDINFVNLSSSDAIGFLWNIAGFTTSTSQNTSFTFPNDNPGNYEVSLWVTNQYGCTDSITQTVIIDGIYTMYVPNAFTPDGDGFNDFFFPQGEGFDPTTFNLKIFNRWGELIFESEAIDTKWDGTFNGIKVPIDVYVWKITAKDAFTGEKHEHRGHVTVVSN